MGINFEQLEDLVRQWGLDRGIIQNGNPHTQCLKTVSEIGELADNIIKNEDIRDSVGDVLVTLIQVTAMCGTNLTECLQIAYEDIKDRKGVLTKEGNFIKESDPAYHQALLDLK